MAASDPTHHPIKGGCLCGSVSYTIAFPAGSKYPPDSTTCQCVQCRKQTGSLVIPFLVLSPSQVDIQPAKVGDGRHMAYESTPGIWRGFCTRCGSTLYWRMNERPDQIEILTGTLDPEFLKGPDARALATPSAGRFWWKDVIEGVTNLEGEGHGPKFVEGSDGARAE